MLCVAGILIGHFYECMGPLSAGIYEWSQIGPHELLLIFMPALIFESAFNCDWHIMKRLIWQVMIMAGPMVIVSTLLTGVTTTYVLGYNGDKFPFSASLLLGSIASATDPVAVVALLKELGASKKLATLIEGESLFNDGTAMVIFIILLQIVEGKEKSLGEILGLFIRMAVGGPIVGLLGGFIIVFILNRLWNNYVLEVNTTIVWSYLIFYVAESK